MPEEQKAVIEQLRNEGFAVVVFTPDELGETDPFMVEDVMTERGWNAIPSQPA